MNRGKKEAVHNPDCRTRLLGVLGDLKNLVKRPLKVVTCAAKFIAAECHCYEGYVFIGFMVGTDDGEEEQYERVSCRRCGTES